LEKEQTHRRAACRGERVLIGDRMDARMRGIPSAQPSFHINGSTELGKKRKKRKISSLGEGGINEEGERSLLEKGGTRQPLRGVPVGQRREGMEGRKTEASYCVRGPSNRSRGRKKALFTRRGANGNATGKKKATPAERGWAPGGSAPTGRVSRKTGTDEVVGVKWAGSDWFRTEADFCKGRNRGGDGV